MQQKLNDGEDTKYASYAEHKVKTKLQDYKMPQKISQTMKKQVAQYDFPEKSP